MVDYLVFVLDDDETSIRVIRDILEKRPGIEARFFETLADMKRDPAIARVDLFILDVRLPGDVSGFEVPARLPARCRFAAFLFVSGFKIDADQYNQAAGLPLFDFMAKPLTPVMFLHRVDLLLAAHVRIPPDVGEQVIDQCLYGPLLSIVIDDRGYIRLCNRSAAEAMGLSHPLDAVGRPWADFDPDGTWTIAETGPAETGPAEAVGQIQATDGTTVRIKWIRTGFDDPMSGPMALFIGVYANGRNKRAGRLRRIYRDLLAKDRAVIRSIKAMGTK